MSKGFSSTIHGLTGEVSHSNCTDFSFVSFSSGDASFSIIVKGPDCINKARILANAMGTAFDLEVKDNG